MNRIVVDSICEKTKMASIEIGGSHSVFIELDLLPKGVKEGDCLRFEIAKVITEEERDRLKSLESKLFVNKRF